MAVTGLRSVADTRRLLWATVDALHCWTRDWSILSEVLPAIHPGSGISAVQAWAVATQVSSGIGAECRGVVATREYVHTPRDRN
ncbi:hypothetical protein PJI17_17795 [Mycobacterium kansasii]